jgi:hypothetical protein
MTTVPAIAFDLDALAMIAIAVVIMLLTLLAQTTVARRFTSSPALPQPRFDIPPLIARLESVAYRRSLNGTTGSQRN